MKTRVKEKATFLFSPATLAGVPENLRMRADFYDKVNVLLCYE